MLYSNGLDYDVILPVLTGRVGWQSTPGKTRNFESFHALLTEANLRDVQPTEGISDTDFTAYKAALEKQILQRCLSGVFNRGEFLEQALLHQRVAGTPATLVENRGLFCGMKLRVSPDMRISVWVPRVILTFDTAVTFNLYLFQDGVAAPIKTQSVTTQALTPTEVDLTDWIMSYVSLGTPNYYIGYFQDDLAGAHAIRTTVFYTRTNHVNVTAVQAQKKASNEFDQTQLLYDLDTLGINAEILAFRDYTATIKQNAALFDEVIGLAMLQFFIEQVLSSTRSNVTERILKGMDRIELHHYLYGTVPASGVAKITGLAETVQQKFQDLRDQFFPRPKTQTVNLC